MISRLYVDEAVRKHPTVHAVQHRLGKVPVTTVRSASTLFETLNSRNDSIGYGKNALFLTRNRGPFLRECPGTKFYNCCGYRILHIGTYCTMDCAYCILQAYFHPPVLQYFVNQENMFAELDALFALKTPPFHRIGTGEFTDSLIWDSWTGLSQALVPHFARQEQIALEIKTKTCAVKHLKGLEHNRKTVVAWSLNSATMIRTQERGTAPLGARLKAAAQCAAWGYPLAFHFDPLIIYDGWEEEYEDLVEQVFQIVSPENIVWISIGSFRFMPSLKPILQERFPQSKIVYGEFVRGLDGKMRYFKPLRIELYKRVVSWIRELAPKVTIYFCMEDDKVWKSVMGYVPEERGGLAATLDKSAAKHCGLSIGQ